MLIGLGHKPRRGKDTVADYLAENFGFSKVSVSEDLIIPQYFDALGTMPTKAQQIAFGMRKRREEGADYWLDQMKELVAGSGANVVWPNVRFPNEGDWVHSEGGVVWKVDRTGGALPREAANTTEQEGGRSETDLTETALDEWGHWDWHLSNDSTMEDLWSQVDAGLISCAADLMSPQYV
tara:strand:- start:258 stop:797 length:540 start_codon:yes stop_codon:yes gene_type:complete